MLVLCAWMFVSVMKVTVMWLGGGLPVLDVRLGVNTEADLPHDLLLVRWYIVLLSLGSRC